MAVAATICFLVLVGLECVLPSKYGSGLHDRGLIAALLGALAGGLFLRGSTPTKTGWRRHLQLSVVALVVGPLLGLTLAILDIWLGDVAPMDRGYTFGVFITIGTVAGMIGAGLFAFIGWLAGRSNRSNSTEV